MQSGTKSGLKLSCSYTPGVSDFYSETQNYTCGVADQQDVPPPGYRFFSFKPGEGYLWAEQIRVRFPENTGEADPGWWADDPPYNEEIDWFEGFGWQAQARQGWCGSDYTGTTDPTWIYDKDPYESIGGETWICRDQGFDPSGCTPTPRWSTPTTRWRSTSTASASRGAGPRAAALTAPPRAAAR